MPACKIQCKDEPEADCGICRYRDKGYPWPGGADGKMMLKGPTLFGSPLVLPVTDVAGAEDAMVVLGKDGFWSHWE